MNFKQWFNVFLIISKAWQGYDLKAYGVSNHNLKLQCKKFNRTRDIWIFPTQSWAGTAFCTHKRSETNVTPHSKKVKAANYRPVSLTSICSKLMEHVIASQLMGHLNTNNILYDLQHGFQYKCSCEAQLLALVHELVHGVNANKQTDMAILDFSKAFDKVSHKHLLYKLQWYGADPLTHAWIADFLRNRTQAVVLEGETSTSVPVISGVPQGTVLDPILFLVYINDLPEYISNSTVQLFADDCILYRQIDSTADCVKLQDDPNALQHWEDMWLMTFNAKKCNIMWVSSSPKPISFDYSIHSTVLENVPIQNT